MPIFKIIFSDSTSINVTSEGSINIASHLVSLSTLLSEVVKLVTPEESRQNETAWLKSTILIHHTPISTTDSDDSSKEYSMVYNIIDAIGTAIKNGTYIMINVEIIIKRYNFAHYYIIILPSYSFRY